MIYDSPTTRALIAAFPGVWIRDDGAFRHDETGICWQPGDVEADASIIARHTVAGDGLVRMGPSQFDDSAPRLRLSQLNALADYIAANKQVSGVVVNVRTAPLP